MMREQELAKLFKQFDVDENGHLGLKELTQVMKELDLRIDERAAKLLIDFLDKNGNGVVSFKEFRRLTLLFPSIQVGSSRSERERRTCVFECVCSERSHETID